MRSLRSPKRRYAFDRTTTDSDLRRVIRVVEVNVRVDDAGQGEQSRGVDLFARGAFGEGGYFSLGDADGGMRLRAADEEVEVRHVLSRAGK